MSIKGFEVGGVQERYDYTALDNTPANLVQDANYVHTDNNFTNADKTKLDGIATGANKTIIDATLTQSGQAADAKATGDELEDLKSALDTKANINGSYVDMTVGNAEQLVATVGIDDSVPYTFRTSGGSADIGDRETDMLVGGTIAWNQGCSAVTSGSNWSVANGTKVVADGVITASSPTARFMRIEENVTSFVKLGHKYLALMDVKANWTSSAIVMGINVFSHQVEKYFAITSVDTWTKFATVFYISLMSDPASNKRFFVQDVSTEYAGHEFSMKNPQLIDLTQMFGSTVADYIYSLEQANAGAGVAFFRKLFPKPYYEYNAGELLSVNASAHKMVGFNAWDEEWEAGLLALATGLPISGNGIRSKNFCRCLPNTAYNLHFVDGTTHYIFWYDESQNFISAVSPTVVDFQSVSPSNARYFKIRNDGVSTANGICINLSWSGSRNGEYEPYVEHTYPLDSSLTLRGIPKLSADNTLYYDGDTYESDGKVTRKYAVVDLGTLNWTPYSSPDSHIFRADYPTPQPFIGNNRELPHAICSSYYPMAYNPISANDNGAFSLGNGRVVVIDHRFSDTASFVSAVNGVYLVYELATPTEETADTYQNPQIVNDFGTEEYIVTEQNGVAVPVGHVTTYPANLRDKLQHLPDLADADGYYMIQQTNNDMSLIRFRIPQAPTTDGEYILKATVSGGTPTYTWEANA